MLSSKFDEALCFASDLHRAQTRKGTAIPYVSHLLAVSSLVLEHDGTEEQAIAALLHDAVEDQGGAETAQAIGKRFGQAVADLVMACTDQIPSKSAPKIGWRVRKAAFIERVSSTSPAAALVITCDKLHNATTIVADVKREGAAALLRFTNPASVGWYYSALAEALSPFAKSAPVGRLQEQVRALEQLVAGHPFGEWSQRDLA